MAELQEIVHICTGTMGDRLREMGLFVGMKVRLIGRAPFMGPWMLQCPTTVVALRDEELKCLNLK